jgi:2-dehydropantoate 2-reductase
VRIGVIGLGAVGSVVAARLLRTAEAGERIALAAGSERAAQALRWAGLSVRGPGPEADVPGMRLELLATALPLQAAPYDLLLLCTRAEATEAALAQALPLLAAGGAVVCLQNGLPEERVAARAGADRTLGAVINWSATAEAPGRVQVTGQGNFVLGGAAAGAKRKVNFAAAVLCRVFPVVTTDNLAGFRWSKLALNCAISTLGAVSGLSFGELAMRREGRALCARVVGEVVAVARAGGVRLERVSGLDPSWLADGGGRAKAALLLRPLRRALVFLASRARPRQRSGMLERLLAGRTSGQVDDLNGAVVAAARARGLLVPLNEKLLALVHAIERGEERIGPHQLERL